MANSTIAFLGTYHFNNPGLDEFNPEVDDVLSEVRQAEIRAVVDALADFNPTHIAVEQPLSNATRIAELYQEFRDADGISERRAEIIQVGFRLAHDLDHQQVHCIDVAGNFPMEDLMAYAAQNGSDYPQWVQAVGGQFMQEFAELQKISTVGQLLRYFNTESALAENHNIYMHALKVGDTSNYAGANLLTEWYSRNFKIFTEITKLIEDDARILVIIGQGHVPILRQLATDASYLDIVPIRDYLPFPDIQAVMNT